MGKYTQVRINKQQQQILAPGRPRAEKGTSTQTSETLSPGVRGGAGEAGAGRPALATIKQQRQEENFSNQSSRPPDGNALLEA